MQIGVQGRQESNEIAIFTKTGNDAEELQEIAVGKSHLVGRRQNLRWQRLWECLLVAIFDAAAKLVVIME